MKNYSIYYILILIVFLLSCKNSSEKLMPYVEGKANDVVVVMSPKYWESEPGEIIRKSFNKTVPGLAHHEPLFGTLWVPHKSFDQLYKKQRNIVIALIGPNYQNEKVLVQKSQWAKTQLVIKILAPNPERFIKLFNEKSNSINNLIIETERNRLINTNKKGIDKSIYNKLRKNHKIKLSVPKGYSIDVDKNNFIWLSNEYKDIIEGLLIYYYPYTDSNTFTKEYLINKRNIILKKNVPGEKQGSYMSTESRFPVNMDEIKLNGKYTAKLNGLWQVIDGFAMGGPFVSLTQYDETYKRIVTVEGFIFAPAIEKRNLIRRIESILYSIDFEVSPEKKTKNSSNIK